jgi:allophanate hydrolase
MEPVMTIGVVGLHLRGEPRNGELTELRGTFLRPARTAAAYRLFRLPTGVPGLVRRALAGIPKPLSLGRVELEDGTDVTGFLCEAYAVDDAEDITASGGWRNHRRKGPTT